MHKHNMENVILRTFLPYGIVSLSTIMAIIESHTIDDSQVLSQTYETPPENHLPEKSLRYYKRKLKDYENNGYIRKVKIYEKKTRSQTATKTTRVSAYNKCSTYIRKRGTTAYVLTRKGLDYIIATYAAPWEYIDQLRILSKNNTDADMTMYRSDTADRRSDYEAATALLREAGALTETEIRGVKSARGKNTKEINQPEKILAAAITKLRDIDAGHNGADHNSHALYFPRKELLYENGQGLTYDNLIGVVLTTEKAFAVYRTMGSFGTARHNGGRLNAMLTINTFLAAEGFGQVKNVSMMIAQKPAELKDLVLGAQGDTAEKPRAYGNKQAFGLQNIAAPYNAMYAIPECKEAIQFLKHTLANTYTQPHMEQIFSQMLSTALPSISYVETRELLNANVHMPPEILSLPKEPAELVDFCMNTFPLAIVAETDDTSTTLIPVLLAYDLNLTNISAAYYWMKQPEIIGEIQISEATFRAMCVACFPWQKEWLQEIFPNAIFFPQ